MEQATISQERKPVTYGYLRVSTKQQSTDSQQTALTGVGFNIDEFVLEHGVSGTKAAMQRPAFSKMFKKLKAGDTVIVTALDRIGRNALDILSTVEIFKTKGIKMRIVALDAVDLTSSTGKLILGVLASVAEMERNLIRERVIFGLNNARKEGRIGGRKKALDAEQEKELFKVFEDDSMYVKDIAEEFGLSERAVFSYKSIWKEKKAKKMKALQAKQGENHAEQK